MEEKTYKVEDLEKILNISRNTAYAYVREVYQNKGPFMVLKIGKSYRIPKKSFDKWLDGDG